MWWVATQNMRRGFFFTLTEKENTHMGPKETTVVFTMAFSPSDSLKAFIVAM